MKLSMQVLCFALPCAVTLSGGLPTSAAPTPPPVNWSGAYAGLNLGVSSSQYDFHSSTVDIQQISNLPTEQALLVVVPGTTVTTSSRHKISTGLTGGGQIGWNSQHGQSVVGVELDLDGISRSASTHDSFALPMTALTNTSTVVVNREAKNNWDASLRLRAGVAKGQVLYYGTAGVAMASVKVSDNDTYTINPGAGAEGSTFGPFPTFVNAKSQTKQLTGWTLGIGAEWAMADRSSFGVELRHTDYGSATYNLAGPGSANLSTAGAVLPQSAKVGLTDDQLNVRYTWRFGK